MNDQLTIHYQDKQSFMTVKELADSFKVTERTILNYVKKLFPDVLKSGKATQLDERQVTAIKLKLQSNQHLERPYDLPKTELEENLLLAQAQQILTSRIERLQKQLEEAKPKIEFHDRVGDSTGLYTIGTAAKVLGTGRNRLFDWLRAQKIFFRTQPYQTFIERGYFEVKTTTVNDHIQKQSFVTPKGLQWLQKNHST